MLSISSSAMSALAVFGGATVGSLSPVLSNYVLQRRMARRDLINREITDRQRLYSDFITEAARLHADSMMRNTFELNELVGLYALTSRIRLCAHDDVVRASEDIVRDIAQRYGESNVTLEDLREAALAAGADPLKRFSEACRRDLQRLIRSAG